MHLQLPDSTEAFPGHHSLPEGPRGASVLEQTPLAAGAASVTGRQTVGIYHTQRREFLGRIFPPKEQNAAARVFNNVRAAAQTLSHSASSLRGKMTPIHSRKHRSTPGKFLTLHNSTFLTSG